MEPAIHKGSAIVVDPIPVDDVAVGDVIVFAAPRPTRMTVPPGRRDRADRERTAVFITKGDANDAPDPWRLLPDGDHLHRVRFDVPRPRQDPPRPLLPVHPHRARRRGRRPGPVASASPTSGGAQPQRPLRAADRRPSTVARRARPAHRPAPPPPPRPARAPTRPPRARPRRSTRRSTPPSRRRLETARRAPARRRPPDRRPAPASPGRPRAPAARPDRTATVSVLAVAARRGGDASSPPVSPTPRSTPPPRPPARPWRRSRSPPRPR